MIIGISGKIGSGKDTIGLIIKYLIDCKLNFDLKDISEKDFNDWLPNSVPYHNNIVLNNWQIRKFADKLKDIVCLLIGCTREQLENQDFKNTELGENWNCWEIYSGETHETINIVLTENEAINFIENNYSNHFSQIRKRNLTPRLLLQLLGTDCGRNIIHPNIWINSLFSDYKLLNENDFFLAGRQIGKNMYPDPKYPNWIITDLRFPNELEAIKKRNGITIRVNRETYRIASLFHESETALDDAQFDYIIQNDSNIEDLIQNVKEILIKERII